MLIWDPSVGGRAFAEASAGGRTPDWSSKSGG